MAASSSDERPLDSRPLDGRPLDERSRVRALLVPVVVAVLLAVLVRTFLVEAFWIPSVSMQPTLEVGDRVVVDKLLTGTRSPRRGEVVVFQGRGEFAGDPVDKHYVKRVIAVAGDRVACCADGRVTVQRAGTDRAVPLDEPYLFGDEQAAFCEGGPDVACPPGAPGVLVPEGRVWVMGDHRGRSADSRANRDRGDGTVGVDQVLGRAVVVVWPRTRVGVLRRPE